jgi:hypothetical protein
VLLDQREQVGQGALFVGDGGHGGNFTPSQVGVGGSVVRWFLVRHSIGGTSPGVASGPILFLAAFRIRVGPGVGGVLCGSSRLAQGFLDQPGDFDTVLHAGVSTR